MTENGYKFETILKWIVLVILAIVALKIVLVVLALAFALGGILLFKVLPLVLLVWLGFRAVEWFRNRNCDLTAVETEIGTEPEADAGY